MVPKMIEDFPEYREVTRPPHLGKLLGLMGHSGGKEAGHRRWRAPPSPIRIGQGVGARPPFPSPSPSFPHSPSPLEGRGGESY